MRQTRKLCSVWLNTAGREMVVRRKVEYDERGWPLHGESVRAEKGQVCCGSRFGLLVQGWEHAGRAGADAVWVDLGVGHGARSERDGRAARVFRRVGGETGFPHPTLLALPHPILT